MVTAFHRAPKARSAVPRRGAGGPALAVLLLCAGISAPLQAARDDESLRGPDVTIIAEEKRTIYEFRQNGELRMVRVVPAFGKPYYLVPRDPTKGFGDLERADMLVPSWVIVEF